MRVEVVRPVLAQVGQMWHDGEITVSHEHRATEIVKSVLARWLAEERTGDRRAVRAIVACAPEELHEVGALTLALLLVNRGFDAEYFGQSVPIEDLRSFVRASKAEAVFLSVSQEERARRMLEGLSGSRLRAGLASS